MHPVDGMETAALSYTMRATLPLDKAEDGQLLDGDINHARTTNRCAINVIAKSWAEKARDKMDFSQEFIRINAK